MNNNRSDTAAPEDFNSTPVRTLEMNDILAAIPHRPPFLFVDRVEILEEGKKGVGIRYVSPDEEFFRGHFPGKPILPGVLILEAMAQTSAALSLGVHSMAGKTAVFISMDNVKFRKPVLPGDQLILKLEALRTGSRVWKMAGKAFVKESLVAEAELMASIG